MARHRHENEVESASLFLCLDPAITPLLTTNLAAKMLVNIEDRQTEMHRLLVLPRLRTIKVEAGGDRRVP